jgi:hypothetical protein
MPGEFSRSSICKEHGACIDGFEKGRDHHRADNHGGAVQENAPESDESCKNRQDNKLGIKDISPRGKRQRSFNRKSGLDLEASSLGSKGLSITTISFSRMVTRIEKSF